MKHSYQSFNYSGGKLMKIPSVHNTSIDNLLLKGKSSVFLSDWNKPDEIPSLDRKLITNAFMKAEKESDKYFFIDENNELKTWFSEVFTESNIHPNNFSISSNGTSTIFLILYILYIKSRLNVILLSPIYFTYINILKNISDTIEYLQIVSYGKLDFNFDELENIINRNNSNLIIINDPLFGSGVTLRNDNYNILINICKKYKVKLLIDYIYGGMEWDCNTTILNNFFIEKSLANPEVIFIESISKRIFLNGIKTSLIFTHPDLIKEFELSSVHVIGALTSPQISIFKQIYDLANRESVLYTINTNISIARENYILLTSLLLGTEFKLSNCNSGYFCLLYIPYILLNGNNNLEISEYFIENRGILTIPHDRYLHFCDTSYCFRINLTISSNILLTAINDLLDLCKK
jgi:aspartate/methionine/tyrosine aminotransferase